MVFGANNNTIAGNYIGMDFAGLDDVTFSKVHRVGIANGNRGVHIASGAQDNVIGGDTLREGNFIAGNATDGIYVNTNGGNPDVVNTLLYNTLGRLPSGGDLANADNNIELNNATITRIANNRIYNAPTAGLQINSAAPDLAADSSNNCLVANTAGVNNDGDEESFINNWWGAADGPSGQGSGAGDSVSTEIIYTPFLMTEPADCTFVVEADLYVTKTVDQTAIAPTQNLSYTVIVGNGGPYDDNSVQLDDTLPTDLTCTYTSVAAGGAMGNTSAGAGDLMESLDLPAGSSVTYTVDCTVSSTAIGTLSNTATVTASLTDPLTPNNSATVNTTIFSAAEISVTKNDDGSTPAPGDQFTYTIVAANAGPNDDPSVTLTDTLPAELDCTYTSVAADGASGNTAAGSGDLMETLDLPANSSVTYTLVCTIDRLAGAGSVSNTATVTGTLPDLVDGNNSATEVTTLDTLELFSDGFESGDTSAWSATQP